MAIEMLQKSAIITAKRLTAIFQALVAVCSIGSRLYAVALTPAAVTQHAQWLVSVAVGRSHQFRFADYRSRFKAPIVNEVGTRDFLPVIAEAVTFGYGFTALTASVAPLFAIGGTTAKLTATF